jgi:hypothetical protein
MRTRGSRACGVRQRGSRAGGIRSSSFAGQDAGGSVPFANIVSAAPKRSPVGLPWQMAPPTRRKSDRLNCPAGHPGIGG